MSIRLFALDMDGTLLQPDHRTISKQDRQAILTATKQGALFVPATGRMREFIPKPVAEMTCWRYAITSNGAAVYDRKEDKLIHADYLDADLLLKLTAVLDEFHVFFEIYADGDSWILKERLEEASDYGVPVDMISFFREKGTAIDSVQAFLKQPHGLEKIYIPYIDPAIHAELKRSLQTFPVAVTSSVDTNLEVNSSTANKGSALNMLSTYLGISMDEVMAIGDNSNDETMLRQAGLGVAMGNAETEIKELADVVTASNEHFGVAAAIEQYVLQEEER